MIGNHKLYQLSKYWFRLGLIAIFLASALIRFWGLGRFNTLVFDEVYYAKFANNYLTGTDFFNAHPPLSQYIIAIGMWLGSHFPWDQQSLNGLAGSLRSTWSYRWLNALTGSFIPLVVAGIAYQLNRRRSYALIAALLAGADGLFLVESRYALNNVYLVILGLLGNLCLLIALSQSQSKRWIILALSGACFGASACIKWNGLWFLFGLYLLWGMALLLQWRREGSKFKPWVGAGLFVSGSKRDDSRDWVGAGLFTSGSKRDDSRETRPDKSCPPAKRRVNTQNSTLKTSLVNLTQLNGIQFLVNFAIIPALTYSLLWIPHLIMNPQPGFWEAHYRILTFHEKIGSGPEVHPYCSKWYTWLIMLRPVAYFYQTAQSTREQVPAYPPLPKGYGQVIYDVHAMGNPILWWLSTAAILLLLLLLLQRLWSGIHGYFPPTTVNYISLYLGLNWLAQLLPWIGVSRCTFLYHYMGASVFSGLGLAWLIDRWLHRGQESWQIAAITVISLILLAFVFWLPIYLGLPLSPGGHQLRMWFRSWI
ncbi:MAG: phospholipid carrier-dependent glycosyltransferase [Coleofasciculus chthonoplastes F3-SA18-01]|uniref:dolichyl-phosphate-mannose--protein mannosyltransferase n=1 Tax=Coleofasciculus chthonoplastes TaxID=64178 RepID=UPI0032F0B11E